jgi:chondroitin sulfate synthase
MQELFRASYEGNASFTKELLNAEVLNAITLHPIKQPKYLYRLHNFLQSRKIMDLREKRLHLQRKSFINLNKSKSISNDQSTARSFRFMESPNLFSVNTAPNRKHRYVYELFSAGSLLSKTDVSPKRGLEAFWKLCINETVRQITPYLNVDSIRYEKPVKIVRVNYGYIRPNPLIGIDYIMDTSLTYFNPKIRNTSMLRHKYARQTFTDMIFREDNGLHSIYLDPHNNAESLYSRSSNLYKYLYNFIAGPQTDPYSIYSDNIIREKIIHFILPLSGRLKTFQRFMNTFEINCLQTNEPVKLAIVLFTRDKDERKIKENLKIKKIVKDMKAKYSNDIIYLVELEFDFSRSIGCEAGASLFADNALLFFIDVDMVFNRDTLMRIRYSTIENRQVYFPIVFSQFDPNPGIFGIDKNFNKEDYYKFDLDHGNWRAFGYGMVSVYYGDLKRVGGFDTSIVGWGKEDVDLWDKFCVSNLTIFRSIDPGLVHVFHKISCDPKLSAEQMIMCSGSKTMSIVSETVLAKLIHEKSLYEKKNMSSSL